MNPPKVPKKRLQLVPVWRYPEQHGDHGSARRIVECDEARADARASVIFMGERRVILVTRGSD
jgi:hypothetical protein